MVKIRGYHMMLGLLIHTAPLIVLIQALEIHILSLIINMRLKMNHIQWLIVHISQLIDGTPDRTIPDLLPILQGHIQIHYQAQENTDRRNPMSTKLRMTVKTKVCKIQNTYGSRSSEMSHPSRS